MIKTSLLAALALAALAGAARAHEYHVYPSAEQRAYYGLVEERSTATTPPVAVQPRSDFGSFSAANTAHTLGY